MGSERAISFTLSIIVGILAILILFFVILNPDRVNYINDNLTEDLHRTAVRGSGSMLPAITPDTELILRDFEGQLKCGHVYYYKNNENKSIVHRFVYEAANESIYFKGDNNNVYDDPVQIEQVKYEVVGYQWLE